MKNSHARWESLLGLALLLLVLGFAAFNWARSNALSDSYHAGSQALESMDWDRAVERFTQAEDYLDAPALLNFSLEQVERRNYFYEQAQLLGAQEDWRGAAVYLTNLQGVQPDYKGSGALLSATQAKAYNHSLAGIVYLMAGREAPGLYARDRAGVASRLPGSDRQSTVRALMPDGSALVYDIPHSAASQLLSGPAQAPAQEPVVADPFGNPDSGRMLALARLDRDFRPTATQALPQLDSAGTGVFSAHGLWWYSSQSAPNIFGYEVYYWREGAGGAPDVTRISDLPSGKRVLAVDPANDRLVIGQQVGDVRGPDGATELQLAHATGRDAESLGRVPGNVYQANISKDGRLLFTAQLNAQSITRSVYVVPLDATAVANPEPLATLTWGGIDTEARLSGILLPEGAPASVLVSKVEAGIEEIVAYAADGSATILGSAAAQGAYRRDSSAVSPDGSYLAIRRQSDVGEILITRIESATWSSSPLPAYDTQNVRLRFSPEGDFVVATVENPEGMNRGQSQRVFSAKRIGTGVDERRDHLGPAHLLASAMLPYDRNSPAIAMPAEGTLLVYVSPLGDLRSVAYDGTDDRLIAEGVRAVWSPETQNALVWWR